MAASSEGTGKGLSGRQIARAAVIVMIGFMLSRLTGLLRETISDGAGNISSDSVLEGSFSGGYVTDIFGDQ